MSTPARGWQSTGWRFLALILLAGAQSERIAAQETNQVTVDNDRVEIALVQPKLRIRQNRSLQNGFYAWRIDLRTKDGSAIAIAADTAMRTDNIRDIVRGSTLRRCPDAHDFSSLRCSTRLADSVSVRNDVVRIVLRDSSLVRLIRADRPPAVWASVFEPNGRFRVDRIRVRFDDDEDHVLR
ncbi:MAG: hypothetical protein ACO1Q7_19945 [Gemmatimonas sp.]